MSEQQLHEIQKYFQEEPFLTKEQEAELMKRIKEHDSGNAVYYDWDDFSNQLEKKFG